MTQPCAYAELEFDNLTSSQNLLTTPNNAEIE